MSAPVSMLTTRQQGRARGAEGGRYAEDLFQGFSEEGRLCLAFPVKNKGCVAISWDVETAGTIYLQLTPQTGFFL